MGRGTLKTLLFGVEVVAAGEDIGNEGNGGVRGFF